MKLYLISQDKNNDYDTFDSAIVAAESEEQARRTHPILSWGKNFDDGEYPSASSWVESQYVKVEYIGEAKEGQAAGVVLASFNAG